MRRELSERDRELLAFERKSWRFPGAKEREVRERFGVSMVRYCQLLNDLIDRPEALAAAPDVVGRLLNARDRSRSGAAS